MQCCDLRQRILMSVLILSAVGCERDVYDLRLEPADKGLVRTLTVWRESEAPAASTAPENVKPNKPHKPEQLKRLGELYPERVTGDADIRQTFRGTFTKKMPVDFGGSGTYEMLDSPLGSAHWYLERFRGNDDLDGQLYDRRTAADRVTDLTVAWFDERLKDSQHREPVHRLLHQEFRQDLRNISIFFSMAPARHEPEATNENERTGSETKLVPHDHPLLRVGQYCIEQGYFTSGELTALIAQDSNREMEILRLVRRLLGKNCKLDATEADKEFAFLAPTDEFAESWRTLLKTTPEYARLLNAWKKLKKPDEEKPEPFQVLEELMTPTIAGPGFLETGDDLRLQLRIPARPYLTNGAFDVDESVVRWRGALNSPSLGLPMLCMASWSVPNEKFQVAHFGSVALKGEALASFVALYGTLAPAHQAEFVKHLNALEPGDALRGRARDFALVERADAATMATIDRLGELLAENL
ncbi:MAG: hypothetical protein K8U03_06535 [Planctomycetia bacterium]|nr:hypothetical protein [Planctomycetia bacterium]